MITSARWLPKIATRLGADSPGSFQTADRNDSAFRRPGGGSQHGSRSRPRFFVPRRRHWQQIFVVVLAAISMVLCSRRADCTFGRNGASSVRRHQCRQLKVLVALDCGWQPPTASEAALPSAPGGDDHARVDSVGGVIVMWPGAGDAIAAPSRQIAPVRQRQDAQLTVLCNGADCTAAHDSPFQ